MRECTETYRFNTVLYTCVFTCVVYGSNIHQFYLGREQKSSVFSTVGITEVTIIQLYVNFIVHALLTNFTANACYVMHSCL